MPKGERRRKRRLDQQGAEVVSENPADISTDDLQQVSTSNASDDVDQSPKSYAADESEAASPKPVALAQILANPAYSEQSRAALSRESEIASPSRESAQASPEPVNAAPMRADGNTFKDPPASSDDQSLPSAADAVETRMAAMRPTREPVIIALLLVALIVLAVDTYFTLRLNGLSDRVSALAAKPSAPIVTAADRPWVGVDTIETAEFANGGQPITTVHIVNSGRQPAYDLRSNTVGSLRAVATAPPEIPAQKGPLATTGLLLPNTGGKLTFFANTRALTAEEAANVKKGQYVLWLAGRLDYKDAAARAHLTTFRYRYDPTLKSFIAAPHGNSAN